MFEHTLSQSRLSKRSKERRLETHITALPALLSRLAIPPTDGQFKCNYTSPILLLCTDGPEYRVYSPLVSHHDVGQSRRGRPDLSQGQCSTLITAQSRGTNAQPLGLHHRCHANYSHISIEIWQTEEGARVAARPERRLRAKRCADLC